MKEIKLGKIRNIEFVFFKFSSLSINQLLFIKSYFKNFKIINYSTIDNKHSKELFLIMNDNINKNILNNLIKNLSFNINDYEIYLIKFNNIISKLNVIIYSIIYQNNEVWTKNNTYKDLNMFFKDNHGIKNAFIDKNELNDNKHKNVFIKINNFQKLNINLNKLLYFFRLFGNINLVILIFYLEPFILALKKLLI